MEAQRTWPAIRRIGRPAEGFALVVTLSLMILLTVIAVGLLSLSSIALRNSGRAEALAAARANARMALQLAIGALQKEGGPDTRITAPADQLAADAAGDATAAAPTRRNWTGVYRSWPERVTARPDPEFLAWLVSGSEADVRLKDFAKSSAAGSRTIPLVGSGTVGDAKDGAVEAPAVACATSAGKSSYAWWIGDQGVKGVLACPVPEPGSGIAATRAALQAASRDAVEVAATSAGVRPFAAITGDDPRVAKLTGWKQGELVASSPAAPKPLFHDLAAGAMGLLTDVRSGGFRKDLSLYLENPQTSVPKNPLYTVNGEPGINESELWLYYNFWKELKTSSSERYTTGGSVGRDTPYLQVEGASNAVLNDPEYLYKQPSIISYQTILSFYARPVTVAGRSVKRLALVVDPIVTYWNPLDVPVVLSPAYNSLKFWQLPYDVTIKMPTATYKASIRSILGAGQWHYMTLIAGKTEPIVMKPGEVLMVSQGANTPVKIYSAKLNFIDGQAGWNFGGGIAIDIKTSGGSYIESAGNDTFTYSVAPNSVTSSGTQEWFLTGNSMYWGEDRESRGESIGIGGLTIDWLNGLPSSRITASQFPDFFGRINDADTRPLTFQQINGRKEPFMLYSYAVKTETDSERPGRFLARYNPKALATDFQTLTADELEALPFEIRIEPLNNVRKFPVSTNGQSYFGGGTTSQTGTSFITSHTIPREPIHSLAAFQHSFANGFTSVSATDGYGMLAVRSMVLPQISHAIGNSMACSVISPDKTSSTLEGPRPLADHSYLANEALWDAWFFSGAAPQTATTFTTTRTQKQVAREFLNRTRPLSNTRYVPLLRGEAPEDVMAKLFKGASPADDAHLLMASYLAVDGMFNVNSTSVEAWKTLFSALKGKAVVVRDASGAESVKSSTNVPVSSLMSPEDQLAEGALLEDPVSTPQWVGRRELTDDDISALARAVVKEVRKRGPFLSLADFVNRRVGSDKSLARCGAIQSALDSKEVPINSAFNTGIRAANPGGAKRGFAFPEAEEGPSAYGIPGVVKQADILTPIGPYLSARSDTFLIRAYGESLDAAGKVQARAWCEAEVRRDAAFVDPADGITKAETGLNPVNKTFGRRFQLVSFRWLTADEV